MSERNLRVNLIFAAAQRATAPMRAIGMGAKGMSGELKKSTDALAKLNRAQSDIAGFRTMKIQLGETRQQLEAAKIKVGALAREIGSTEKPTRKMMREFTLAKKEAADLKTKFGEQQGALQKLRGSLNDAGIGTTGLSEHQKRLRTDIGRTSAEIDQQKAKLGALKDREDALARGKATLGNRQALGAGIAVGGASAVGAGVALAAPVVGAAKAAMTFESRMIDVQKVLQNTSPAQLKVIEDGLLNMSAQGPIAAEGLGQIAAEGARAGIAARDLLSFSEGAMKMAASFDIEAGEAAGMMSAWRNAMSLTQPQVISLGDKVNGLTNSFGGAPAAVSQMITRVGPLGKIAGVANGELASMAQLLNSLKIESEIGATGIKNMMLGMIKGKDATKTQKAAFAELGIEAVDLSKRMQVDAKGGILSVLDAVNKLDKSQQAGMLTRLFGSESVLAISPMLSNLDQLKRNFNFVGNEANYAGSMNKEFGVAMSKTENQVSAAKNAIGGAGISLGQQLLPSIKIGAEWIRKIGIGIGGWAKEHPALTKGIGLTIGVLAGLLILVGGLAIGIGAILGPFALLRYSFLLASPAGAVFSGSLKSIGGAFGSLTRILMANPILLIVAGIALAALAIYNHWDKIGPWFGKVWAGVKAIFSVAFTVFKAILFTFTPAGLIYKHWDTIGPWFGKLWDGVSKVFGTTFQTIKGVFLNYTPAGLIYKHWDTIQPYFSALWGPVAGFFSAAWGIISGIFVGTWSLIKSAAEGNFNPYFLIFKYWDKITGFFSTLWGSVKTIFSSAWEGIKGLMSGWAGSALGVGAGIIGAIGSGIRNGAGAIWEALKSTVFGAINRVKEFFGGGSESARPKVATVPMRTGPKLAGARALGGPVLRGLNYLVGEQGEEIFTPDQDGQIIPNNAIGGRTARKFVTGSAIAALAASPAYASPARPAAAPNGGGDKYTIVINAKDAGSPQDIAAAVRREIESIEREKDARRRSSYSDDY